MIAKITPLVRLPSSVTYFDYEIPEELTQQVSIGSLVHIPFRSKQMQGVVLDIVEKTESTYTIKPITEVLEEEPILTDAQIQTLKNISHYYGVSMGAFIRMIVPEKPKRPRKTIHKKNTSSIRFSIHADQLESLQQLSESTAQIHIKDISSALWWLRKQCAHTQQQHIIFVPTIHLIQALANTLEKSFPERVITIHSGKGKTETWNDYLSVRSQTDSIVITTRQGAFLPIQKNASVWMFEPTSQEYKQSEQHPRYHAFTVLQEHAKHTESSIHMIGASFPFGLEQEKTELPPARDTKQEVLVADMQNEMQSKSFSIVGTQAMQEIENNKAKGKKTVLFSLRHESEEGVSSKRMYDILTQSLKNCKIAIIDSQSQNINTDADVLITTQAALESLKLASERGSIGTLVIASLEPLFAIPDYRSKERAYHAIQHLLLLARELGVPRVLFQTYTLESSLVQSILSKDPTQLIQEELEARKELNYPPFADVVKCTYKGKDTEEPDRFKQWIANELPECISITGPHSDQKNGTYLLLKIPLNTSISQLQQVPADWAIDRDPERVM